MQRLSLVALALVVALGTAASSQAAVLHFEGFEALSWVANMPGNWSEPSGASIVRVTSRKNAITSSAGSAHAIVGASSAPIPPATAYASNVSTGFGGGHSSFGQGYLTALDIYLDPMAWAIGQGFDYSIGVGNQSASHLRDFIFHVGQVDNQGLLVNASNNTTNNANSFKLQNENGGMYFTVQTAGWYTFEQLFRNDAGVLAVDFNLRNDMGGLLYSVTRSTPADLIATQVGGIGYGWFIFNNLEGLAIDNTSLSELSTIPEPTSFALLLPLAGFATWRKRRSLRRQHSASRS